MHRTGPQMEILGFSGSPKLPMKDDGTRPDTQQWAPGFPGRTFHWRGLAWRPKGKRQESQETGGRKCLGRGGWRCNSRRRSRLHFWEAEQTSNDIQSASLRCRGRTPHRHRPHCLQSPEQRKKDQLTQTGGASPQFLDEDGGLDSAGGCRRRGRREAPGWAVSRRLLLCCRYLS